VCAAVADESQRVGAENVVRIVTPLPYLTIVLTVCIIFASNYSQSPLISPNDDMYQISGLLDEYRKQNQRDMTRFRLLRYWQCHSTCLTKLILILSWQISFK